MKKIIFVFSLLISVSVFADDAKFFVGLGTDAARARVKGVPGGTFENNPKGIYAQFGYNFTDALSLTSRFRQREDLDILVDDGDGDLDIYSADLLLSLGHQISDSMFHVRGELGFSRWRAEGYSEETFQSGNNIVALIFDPWYGEYVPNEGSRFHGWGTDPVAGFQLSMIPGRRVEYYVAYEYQPSDYLELRTVSIGVNFRFR